MWYNKRKRFLWKFAEIVIRYTSFEQNYVFTCTYYEQSVNKRGFMKAIFFHFLKSCVLRSFRFLLNPDIF